MQNGTWEEDRTNNIMRIVSVTNVGIAIMTIPKKLLKIVKPIDNLKVLYYTVNATHLNRHIVEGILFGKKVSSLRLCADVLQH